MTETTLAPTVKAKTPRKRKAKEKITILELGDLIYKCLDDNKAEQIVRIPLKGISQIADEIIIASGLSSRHVCALGEFVVQLLKESGWKKPMIEGMESGDWVLIDIGDIMIHLFKPEIRSIYNLEKLWSGPYQPPEMLQE